MVLITFIITSADAELGANADRLRRVERVHRGTRKLGDMKIFSPQKKE